MLASIQAPIIMMSQSRPAAKDRLEAAHDYEVNLKEELVEMQQEQIRLLTKLLEEKNKQEKENYVSTQNHAFPRTNIETLSTSKLAALGGISRGRFL